MIVKNLETLHLNLYGNYFDQIESGEKKEEYREITPYWNRRITNVINSGVKTITFSNGYAKNRRQMVVELKSIERGIGNPNWGAPQHCVYILKLGNKLN